MPVKKTKGAKKKTGARRGRPPGSKNKVKNVSPPTKKSAAKKSTAKKKTGSGRGGFHREINEETGFVVGTDQDAIALALLEGGESRSEIAERLAGQIDTETRNGTEKQITNMVSGVLNKMIANGFTVEQSFQVLPPTPASKRAASRNSTKKTAAKKSPAKKTASGKRRGRPPGSKNKKKK